MTVDLPRLDLSRLLHPRSVAIIGASPNPAGHAGRCLANLERGGFRGDILPVNPKYDEVSGYPAVPSIEAVSDPVDTAYILLPAAKVEAAVEQCVAQGVANVVICSSGFGELGAEGREAQARLTRLARASGTRLLGPNCIGVVNVPGRYLGTPTFNITTEHRSGGLTILSHSGGMAAVMFNRAQARGIGVRAVVSLGNEADLELAELVDALVDDPETHVIGAFVEQLRSAERFLEAVARAEAVGKPVIVLKTGRSEAGRRAAFGHTGALAGEHEVFSGVMRQAGVIEVATLDELLTTADLLGRFGRIDGSRIGVVSPSGGEASYVADAASGAGLELPELAEQTQVRLQELLELGNPGNPLDSTGKVIGDADLLRTVLEVFAADPSFDAVLVAIPTWGDYDNRALLPTVMDVARNATRPMVVSAWQARGLTDLGDQLLRDGDVAHAPTPDAALTALRHVMDPPRSAHRPDDALQEARVPVLRSDPELGRQPDEHQAKRMLAEVGLPVAEEILVESPQQAAEAAGRIGGRTVLKLLVSGVTHKSDLGLVRVGLASPVQVEREAVDLLALAEQHGLAHNGLLVARYVAGTEVIVGVTQDPTFGPVIMVGAGGIYAEVLHDVAFRRAPLTPVDAEEAVSSLRVDGVLRGARGKQPDRAALLRLLCHLSEVAAISPELIELDCNPVIVSDMADGGGAWIVDAVVGFDQAD